MSAAAQGGDTFHHRSRLFPLPILAAAVRPPCSSARVRARFKVQRLIVEYTNHCICYLNRLYASPSVSLSIQHSSQPDILHCIPSASSESISAAQLRTQAHLRGQCSTLVLKDRAWRSHSGPTRDIDSSVSDIISVLTSPLSSGSFCFASAFPTASLPARDSLAAPALQSASPSLPHASAFSSSPTAVVPLIASRIALPDSLNIVPMLSILPADVAASYEEANLPQLLRSAAVVHTLNFTHPLRAPRVAGSRAEYVQLVGRMQRVGMLGFTAAPLAVNGVFAVAKDSESDRLIIDAQPANRLFIDSPHVSLPGPSHLVQLHVPAGCTMYTAKSDLSNFYHHIGLPDAMQPYFALPPLSPGELASLGLPAGAAFPMCRTLPMGFSHAVYIAERGHEHVLYGSGAIDRADNLLQLVSPTVTRDGAQHGIVIDDFFLFSLNQALAERLMQRVLAAYRAAGFVVKQSKVVMPTSAPVKVIGFDIDGAHGTISLPLDSQRSLVQSTIRLLRAPFVTGAQLAHVIGRWTWVMMLRRPSLAILQHVYRYCRVAQGRSFTLWACVRRELCMLLGVLPLLHAQLQAGFFHRAIASDASELAAGVVSTPLTPELHSTLWPLCASRHHAVVQALFNAERTRTLRGAPTARSTPTPLVQLLDDECMQLFEGFYSRVELSPWRTLVSKAWHTDEHINVLELRAALLAVHWVLTYPSSLTSRVYLLLDSTVAFFTLWKGRSSSPRLLLVLRKISALLLSSSLSLLSGWVPSAVNPADAPSRLLSACPLGRLAA